jgi:hypothetical protein
MRSTCRLWCVYGTGTLAVLSTVVAGGSLKTRLVHTQYKDFQMENGCSYAVSVDPPVGTPRTLRLPKRYLPHPTAPLFPNCFETRGLLLSGDDKRDHTIVELAQIRGSSRPTLQAESAVHQYLKLNRKSFDQFLFV